MQQTIYKIVIAAVPLIFAITVHEAAHGWVANKCGDDTAHKLGRITLNPLKHIDLLGTIIIPLVMLLTTNFIFGYAKPVPVNWNQLKSPRRDMALVAIAGPFVNLIMALIWAGIARIGMHSHLPVLIMMAIFGIQINILLCLLNLIPIPPLDGSRVVSSLLPPKIAYYYNSIEPYGFIILVLLLISGALSMILLPHLQSATAGIASWFGIPY